ncbi:MAG: hypothetical protein L0Z62_01360 [Gemmataceae bacterium]|nr:hypothetical protein [Gemmataceae bacterium]
MNRQRRPLKNACLALLALAVLGALPEAARASGIGFRNELKIPILVQGESMVDGVLRRGPPLVIHPGKIVWDTNVPAGERRVTIYEAAQPNRPLWRDIIRVENADQAFRVILVPAPAGAPPKVQLRPIQLP